MKILKTNVLSEKQINEIKVLENLAFEKENLQNHSFLSNEINFNKDFPCFYLGYENNELISFLTTFVPTTFEAEIIAVTNPTKRRKGYFKELFYTATQELLNIGINNILFVIESNSKSGEEAVNHFQNTSIIRSEYRMVCKLYKKQNNGYDITYKTVDNSNKHYFKDILSNSFENQDENDNFIDSVINIKEREGYLQYYNCKPVGCFSINYENNDIFLYGVGVVVEQRRKGFGKELVKFAQNLAFMQGKKIVLDVDSDNPVAFNLYKSCGFYIDFQADYYKMPIK